LHGLISLWSLWLLSSSLRLDGLLTLWQVQWLFSDRMLSVMVLWLGQLVQELVIKCLL
jgi:hypothetical protein